MTLTQRTDDLYASSMSAYERRIHSSRWTPESSAFSAAVESARDRTSDGQIDWSHDALITIKEMWSLGEGWDSYGAPRTTIAALEFASEFVETLRGLPRPFVAPTSEGGVMFEWRRPDMNFVVEVTSTSEVEAIYHLPDGSSWAGSLQEMPLDAWRIADLLLSDAPRS